MITMIYSSREAILAAITGTAGLLEVPVSVGLYLAGLSVGTRTTFAEVDAEKATFDGYAAKTIAAWSAQFRDGADNVYQDGGELLWVCTGSTTPNVLGGAYWFSGTDLFGVEAFAVPVSVAQADDPVSYIPVFAYGQ